MNNSMMTNTLEAENRDYRGRGGVSSENRGFGFVPAFMDTCSGQVYRACFADGRPAPFHLLDGLPDQVVLSRSPNGGVLAVMASVISGFLLGDRFYTREEAAHRVAGMAA
jgi:hypothetical protein